LDTTTLLLRKVFTVTRRRFIYRLLQGFKLAAVMGGGVACARSVVSSGSLDTGGEQPFIPLNGKSLASIARSKQHHGGKRFINPFSSVPKGNMIRVLKWKLFAENHFTAHYHAEPVTPVTIDWDDWSTLSGLSVTLIKHATIYIRDRGFKILIDPVFDDMFWGIKDFSPLTFPVSRIPDPDLILITHGHYDHLNAETLSRFPRSTRIVSPLGYNDVFDALGFRQRTQLDWFDSVTIDGVEVTLLPCNHWTMRNPIEGPNTSLWGSYLVRTRSGANLYLSGDTGYFDGFGQIGDMVDIDLAVFNVGAYEPRWFMASSHANPKETARAFQELKARNLMIAHWGTYRLGDEPVHFPPIDMARSMNEIGLGHRLIRVDHGETLNYDGPGRHRIIPQPS
jgi:L-ascorbate metabolism protein UlaG (beta-lactamase superfamily)